LSTFCNNAGLSANIVSFGSTLFSAFLRFFLYPPSSPVLSSPKIHGRTPPHAPVLIFFFCRFIVLSRSSSFTLSPYYFYFPGVSHFSLPWPLTFEFDASQSPSLMFLSSLHLPLRLNAGFFTLITPTWLSFPSTAPCPFSLSLLV